MLRAAGQVGVVVRGGLSDYCRLTLGVHSPEPLESLWPRAA